MPLHDRPADDTPRVAFALPGLGRVRRGAEAAFLRIARGLRDEHGLAVELFGGGEDFPAGLTGHRVRCVSRKRFERFPSVPAFRSDCHYEEMTFALGLATCREFRASRFDAVVTCSYPHINWLLQRGRWGRVPHLFVTQNGDWMCHAGRREYRYFRASHVACLSPEQLDRVAPHHPATLIPNGVDAGRFTPRRRVGSESPHVLMVGALIDSKNVLDGIEAVAAVPNATLTVVGDGPLRGDVRNRLADRLRRRSAFHALLPPAETARLFESADVFLHMSRDEPFGLVYLEAMAAGCPVVAHNGPTQRWLCGDAAALCETRSTIDVAKAIRLAASPGVAGRLSEAGPARVADGWTWDRQIDCYADLLRDMTHAAAPRRLQGVTA